jgi:DNA helicase-2/ATP-dependent DNA helicase PcrA
VPDDPAAASGVTDPLHSLNAAQREAVLHGQAPAASPPLLVIAGAGSGKTNMLAHRVAHLVAHGADPQRILLLTFSRRAAAELERRAALILTRVLRQRAREATPRLPWAGTFHAVGARLLREHAERIGLAASFTIHDRSDSEDQLAIVRQQLGLAATRERFPNKATCLAIYSQAVNSGRPLEELLPALFPWCCGWEAELRKLFRAYVAAKQAQQVLDYDDLLLYWSYLMAEEGLAREVGGRFDHVLVDEYQDTNRLQAAILLGLKPDGRGVTVVGDDAQAIYSFRAATVRNILDFPAQFTPPARVITLDRNYRSTQAILESANAVIALARERYTKDLWSDRTAGAKPRLVNVADETEQARYVADDILARREQGVALKAQAVLFRSASHSAQLELELARRNIPFVKYGGLKFLEAAHVKDVLSVLRWAENPRGRLAGFRVACLVPGIGPATATRLLDTMEASAEPMRALARFQPPAAAEGEWKTLLQIMDAIAEKRPAWPADIDAVLRWYRPQLERLHEDADVRAADLAQLAQIASTYPSRERFLTELTLDPPSATSDEAGMPERDDDYLILSTIHSAKGQEWRNVHLLNVVDGCIPSDMATGTSEEIEEERRLLYVAMTRARDALHLLVPQRFFTHQQGRFGDRHVYAARSRFLPPSLDERFDCIAWPAVAVAEPPASFDTKRGVRVDLGARARSAW